MTKVVQPHIQKFQSKLLGNFVSTMSPMIYCIPFQQSVVYMRLLMQQFILFQFLVKNKCILTYDVRIVCYFIYY